MRTGEGLAEDICKLITWFHKFCNNISFEYLFTIIHNHFSMCSVLSWNIGSDVIWKAIWLSHTCSIWPISPNFSYLSNCLIQISSQVAIIIARYSWYSTSALNLTGGDDHLGESGKSVCGALVGVWSQGDIGPLRGVGFHTSLMKSGNAQIKFKKSTERRTVIAFLSWMLLNLDLMPCDKI